MHYVKVLTMYCFILCAVSFSQAQTNPMVADWERAKAYTKEYLDAMPDSGYAYKVTPDTRSFAQQFLHLSDANYGFGAAATGEKSPLGMESLEKTKDMSKANVTKLVLDSYDFVINGLKKMKPQQLNEKVKVFGKFDMTRKEAIDKDFEHQTHHRGQATIYLRLVGVTPPQEKLF